MSRRKRWFRLGILGLIVGLITGVITASWLERAELRKQIRLAKSEGLPVEPADLRRIVVSDADNAYPDLLEAWALLHSRFLPQYKRLDSSLRGGSNIGLQFLGPGDDRDLEQIQPVIRCLRRAAHKPKADFHRRWEDGPEASYDFADIGVCVKLLLANARRCDHLGRPEEATQDSADAARLSFLVSTEPDLTAVYTGIGCQSLVETELENWLWNTRLAPGVGNRIRRVVDAMGPMPDVRETLGGQLVLERQGIRALERATMRSLVFRSGRLHSLRFAHVNEVRDAYDIRLIQCWRRLYHALPADDSDLIAVHRALVDWASETDLRGDWTYDYLHMMGFGLSNFGSALKSQLARRRVLLTLGELLEMQVAGKSFDGKLAPSTDHIDPCTGKQLRVIAKPGRWIVYSLGPDQIDFGGERPSPAYGNVRQNIVAQYPRPLPKPPVKAKKRQIPLPFSPVRASSSLY